MKTLRWNNDKELLIAAVEGNKAATEEVLDLLSDDAIRLAWRLLGTLPDAEDVVQEAFIKLWHSYAEFKGDAKLKTYFYTIVQRRCFDHLRTNHPLWNQSEDAIEEVVQDSLAEQQELISGVELKNAIHLLPPKQRIAITLWAYYDHTAEEIAKQLEMNKNAVDQLLHRAKVNLKNYFEFKEVQVRSKV